MRSDARVPCPCVRGSGLSAQSNWIRALVPPLHGFGAKRYCHRFAPPGSGTLMEPWRNAGNPLQNRRRGCTMCAVRTLDVSVQALQLAADNQVPFVDQVDIEGRRTLGDGHASLVPGRIQLRRDRRPDALVPLA